MNLKHIVGTVSLAATVAASALAEAQMPASQASGMGAAMDHSKMMADAPQGATSMTDGEVRKIDKAQGKITLKHGPIANLEMPGMTMVFRVTEPKMLELVKEGDKVKFSADRINGAISVTAIEVAK